jgi:small subunit ribosomal protein S6
MRPYEVMVVIDPTIEDAQVKASFGRVSEIIVAAGGTIRSAEIMGKRKLAYEIDKKTEGIYGLVVATAPPTVVVELNRVLQLADEVMRHKVILIPEKVVGAASGSEKLRAASSSDAKRQESETPA